MNRKFLIIAVVILALWILTGCGGKQGLVGGGQNGGQSLQSITLTPTNPTVSLTVPPAAPATEQFVAMGTYNFGNPQNITTQVSWSSADMSVVTIDKNGVATAVASGRAYITAQIQDPVSGKLL